MGYWAGGAGGFCGFEVRLLGGLGGYYFGNQCIIISWQGHCRAGGGFKGQEHGASLYIVGVGGCRLLNQPLESYAPLACPSKTIFGAGQNSFGVPAPYPTRLRAYLT